MDALERADVLHLATRSYQSLSGGERQRVHFARALAQLTVGRTLEERQILFLDEPVASLDLRHQLRVLAEARQIAERGAAVVAVLHDLQLASELADDLILLAGGRRIASGPAGDVLNADTLAQVFGVKARSSVLPPMPWTAL
jgi:iron complex transport system ATP-binding protein